MSISFKSLIMSICDSVAAASDTLRDRNEQFLASYFTREEKDEKSLDVYKPKSVLVETPYVNEEGAVEDENVEVPLLSMTSHSSEQIERFSLKLNIQAFVEDDVLKVDLEEKRNRRACQGTLEITISPTQSPEGLEQLVNKYESVIKGQL